MKTNRTKWLMVSACLALFAGANCQPAGGGEDDGLGGGGASGGEVGDGDGTTSGGRTGSGGRAGSGGRPSSGGRSGTGGSEMDTGGSSFGGACESSGLGGFGGNGGAPASIELFDGDGIYVRCRGNSLGFQGVFYLVDDSMGDGEGDGLTHSDLDPDTGGTAESGDEPSEFGSDTVMPCVSGSLARVTDANGAECASEDCLWVELWGGAVALDLSTSDGGGTEGAWNAAAHELSGFTFSVTGDVGGAVVRFTAFVPGSDDNYCAEIAVGGETSVDFSELRRNCWDGSSSEVLDPAQIQRIQWQIVTDQFSSYEVENFCVESLSVY